ncbi:MAG: hypothetical protein NVS3B2_09040 [Ramlibacter sp.]
MNTWLSAALVLSATLAGCGADPAAELALGKTLLASTVPAAPDLPLVTRSVS